MVVCSVVTSLLLPGRQEKRISSNFSPSYSLFWSSGWASCWPKKVLATQLVVCNCISYSSLKFDSERKQGAYSFSTQPPTPYFASKMAIAWVGSIMIIDQQWLLISFSPDDGDCGVTVARFLPGEVNSISSVWERTLSYDSNGLLGTRGTKTWMRKKTNKHRSLLDMSSH